MSNPYYNSTGVPATRAQLSSSSMRAVFASIAAGFDKLAPALTANALLHVNAAGTQYAAHASITVSAAGAVAGITDLTTTGNTVLGNASTDTLNVGNGGLVKASGGNVGIGTAGPSHNLHVIGATSGRIQVEGGSGYGMVFIQSSGANTASLELNATGGSGRRFSLSSTSAGDLRLSDATAGADRLVIDASGNMGVGTNGPTATLHVVGTARIDATTSTSATAGGASALPATPGIYLTINVGGTDYKFAGYPV